MSTTGENYPLLTQIPCNLYGIVHTALVPHNVRRPTVKKGRHRRFEEARKLKQAGPSAADLGFGESQRGTSTDDDEYAAIAERYGVRFDDDDDESDDDLD